jgi:hypothetical protein
VFAPVKDLKRKIALVVIGAVATSTALIAVAPPAAAATFTVDDVGDGADATLNGTCSDSSNNCTLRAAIQEADNTTAKDVINFDIGTGVQTITPDSALPQIDQPVVIDGTTQPGYSGSPIIEISGDDLAAAANGLSLNTNNSVIKGLIVNGFDIGSGTGIYITGNSNKLRNNYVGLETDGATLHQNVWGIRIIEAEANVIGGPKAAHRNVLSGNQAGGLVLFQANGNEIGNNYIGLNAGGTQPASNLIGINLYDSDDNILGPGNVIGGQQNSGTNLDIQGGDNNVIRGNYIGTDKTGTIGFTNAIGIQISNLSALSLAEENVIGGSFASARNIISGNSIGVHLHGERHVIRGNYIGLARNGKSPLPNTQAGIRVSLDDAPASNNMLGGFKPGQGNRIAFNSGPGIVIDDEDMFYNTIFGNSIYGNGSLGIDLKEEGFTPNDDLDTDDGPNGTQNFPTVRYVAPYNGRTKIKGTLSSAPNQEFFIGLFSSKNPDASGFGEGAAPLGSVLVSTNASGKGRFSTSVDRVLKPGEWVTATATDVGGSTSEFSAAKDVCTVLGTNDGEKLEGTPGKDVICGRGGRDRILGGGGADVLLGGKGHDKIFGESGRDWLEGQKGDDKLDGGSKRDTCNQGPGSGARTSCEKGS